MKFLYFLAQYRTPLLNGIMLALTQIGSSKILVVIDILVFWCLDKEAGFYLLTTSGISVFINQMLKTIVRMPRPWILDENFSAVEAAKEGAGGFSFPSGHSQNAGAHMTAYALLFSEKKGIRALAAVLVILIPLSRMFLGVHTPLDVAVGLLCGIPLSLLFYKLYYKDKRHRLCHLLSVILAVIQVIYHRFFTSLTDINDIDGLENAVTVLALMLGVWISYEADRRYLRFSTEGSTKKQILKVLIGLPVFLAILAGLLYGLPLVGLHRNFTAFVAYLLACLFAGCVWPYLSERYIS